jgi:hypothetical protein
MTGSRSDASVEQWAIFELSLPGSSAGNPFLEVEFAARFSHRHRTIEVDGFYDGDGVYKARFMPDVPGEWRFVTVSNQPELDGVAGSFTCTPVQAGNHGPVRVADAFHFAYADGTPFKQIGTTCYAWSHQGDELEERTLATLREAPFNKLRMCVFPKHYAFNENEPALYPFPCLSKGSSTWTGSYDIDVKEGWAFDFDRFEPAFFRHLERRVEQLRDQGIEADLILFHPYDRWGFATMDAAHDDRYLRYVVARLAAYRNVWWSMANEYDLMPNKRAADWERFFRVVQERDPYQHLRSIHNCRGFYDHGQPWVTHCSVQRSELALVRQWREQYGKPVVVDECCYEGDIWQFWGNISAQELVHRFWLGTANGGYVGHGETYAHPDDILWWSKGGALHGESAPRLAFLRQILEHGPERGLDPVDGVVRGATVAGRPHDYYLVYFGVHQPGRVSLVLPEGERYRAEVIDTWGMSSAAVEAPVTNGSTVNLPARPYHAIVLRREA